MRASGYLQGSVVYEPIICILGRYVTVAFQGTCLVSVDYKDTKYMGSILYFGEVGKWVLVKLISYSGRLLNKCSAYDIMNKNESNENGDNQGTSHTF